jgi:hypothetical protein
LLLVTLVVYETDNCVDAEEELCEIYLNFIIVARKIFKKPVLSL